MDFDAFPIDILYNKSLKEVDNIKKEFGFKSNALLSFKKHESESEIKDELSVSLIIPTIYNGKLKSNSLKHVLKEVNKSKLIKEIIIVANDGLIEEYQYLTKIAYPKKVEIVFNNSQTERASSRNFGVSNASGRYILFLDDDMIIKDWAIIDDILITLKKENKKAALFPPRVYLRFPYVLEDSILLNGIESWESNQVNESSDIFHDPIQEGDANISKAFCFPGCFGIIQKDAHELIGGFDSNYIGWGWEDVDYALRLIGSIEVLNLFYRCKGALHIDHAVSPYKQKEMLNTYKTISPKFNYTDFGTICDDIIGGIDFKPEVFNKAAALQSENIPKVLKTIEKKLNINLTSKSVINRYKSISAERASHGQGLHPKWVIIHGSRGAGTPKIKSDYDILVLHSRGLVRQFHTPSDLDNDIEFEYSDIGKFVQISDFPFVNPVQGPLELVKIAYGKILWGDKESWDKWKKNLLRKSIINGGLYWKLMAIGLILKNGVNEISVIKYCKYLADVIELSESFNVEDYHSLKTLNLEKLIKQVAEDLDKNFLNWRTSLDKGEILMKGLMPEMYIALNYLRKL